MKKRKPDYSFERDGVPLAKWLWRLVADERPTRDAAGNALGAMYWGMPSADTDFEDVRPLPDMESQADRFKAAVREVAASTGFDTAEFVRRLCAYRVGMQNEWLRRVRESFDRKTPSDEQWQRIADRLTRMVHAAADEATRLQAKKRLARALCAMCDRELKGDDFEGAEAMTLSATIASFIFEALDTAYLAAPEALLLVLEQPQHSRDALAALARIGPPAIAFVQPLLGRVDGLAQKKYPDHELAAALGSIGRGNGVVVDALLTRLGHAQSAVRGTAAATLACMGTDVAGRADEVIARLFAVTHAGDDVYHIIQAIASVGRHDLHARRHVIELARSRPAHLLRAAGGPAFDQTMIERGAAIDAMQYLAEHPDECVPVLIECLESFEEYDPDWEYDGPVARVARALERFGPEAAEAAPILAGKLGQPDAAAPRAIRAALAAIRGGAN